MGLGELSLVFDVIISSRFKVPEFQEYGGIEYPKTQLVICYQKMFGHACDKEIVYTCPPI